MKKTDDSRAEKSATGNVSTSHTKAPSQAKNYQFINREQTIFLTSLIGTQLLLTTSPPDYPIMKTVEVETEEIS